jgi:hypothetical protein
MMPSMAYEPTRFLTARNVRRFGRELLALAFFLAAMLTFATMALLAIDTHPALKTALFSYLWIAFALCGVFWLWRGINALRKRAPVSQSTEALTYREQVEQDSAGRQTVYLPLINAGLWLFGAFILGGVLQ